MTLHFDLLGSPRVTLDGRLIELPPKSLALIAYLLINGRSKRETLATILWPNVSANPRNNLSQERSSLSNHLGFDILEGSKEFLAVQDTVTCDALTFAEQSTTAPLAAWSLYRGEFLTGIEFHPHLLGNRAFGEEYEGWLSQQRSEFDGLWRQLSLGLATKEIKRGAIERAIPLLEAAQQNEHSISENAARLLMLCHSILGQSDQVLQVFIQITKQLKAALGVKPMRFTEEVFGVSRDEPQNALEVLHKILPPDSFPPPRKRKEEVLVKFVGRETELAELLGLLETTLDVFTFQDATTDLGVRGVLLLGEPGVGKTRLLEECLAAFKQKLLQANQTTIEPWYTVTAQALPDQIPLLMFQKAARTVITQTPEALKRLSSVTRTALARLLPEFLESEAISLPPDLEQRALFSALRVIFSSASQPTLLVLEDLHWADQSSIAFIEYLFGDAPEKGLLLLATARDSEGSRTTLDKLKSLIRNRASGLIQSVTGLSIDAVNELVNAFNRTDIDSAALHLQTGGNPLFVTLLLQGKSAGRQKITELILDRVRACGELETQTLEALAVLGSGKTIGMLRDVSGRSLEETVTSINVLQAAKLISETEVIGFRHDLIRELIYESLPSSRKALLELRTARVLRTQPVLAAPHFLASRAVWDQETTLQAGRSFLEAGRQFATLGDSRAGLGWLDLAWQADDSVSWRLEVTLVRARVLERYGLVNDANDALARAEVLLGDASKAHRAAWWNLKAQLELSMHGNHIQAHEYANRALEESQGSSQPDLLLEQCRSLRYLGWSSRINRDFNEAVTHLRAALILAQTLGAIEEEVLTLILLGLCLIDLGKAEAHSLLQRALTLLTDIETPIEIYVLNASGRYFELVEKKYDKASEYFYKAYEKSVLWNISNNYIYLNNIAAVKFYEGLYYEAKNMYQNVLDEFRRNNSQNEFVLAQIFGNLAEVEMRLGKKEDSLYYLAEATKILERNPNKSLSANLRYYEGELWTLHGQIDAAKLAYAECSTRAAESNYQNQQALALSRMALLEHSPIIANQALELSPTPLVNATVLILQGNVPAAMNLIKDDKFEQGFLYLARYLWAKEKDDLESAQELLGFALRLN